MRTTTSGLVAMAMSMSWSCVQTTSMPTQSAYVPRGQAAQPGWGGAHESASTTSAKATPRGRAAQPGGWHPAHDDGRDIAANTGVHAGQAAQPGWHQPQSGMMGTSRAAAEGGVTPPRSGEAWSDTTHHIQW